MPSHLARIVLVAVSVLSPIAGFAQTPAAQSSRTVGTVSGSVKDATGGIIPGAMITLSDGKGLSRSTQAGSDGNFTFRGVGPGAYTVSVTYPGLQQPEPLSITVQPNATATANLTMTLQVQKQELTVTDSSTNAVSTDPANNATALVLKPEDLDALPDDPDDLQADLQALAGPGAGPGGNQIYIDGFTGGRLPPKESIREIRINSNPFSAEYDKVGFGRIQIFTKPGSDKFHGQGFYQISDDVWNSRNPFSNVNPPFRSQMFGGNVSGPLGKKASFFFDIDRRNIDDNGIIVATIPNSSFTAPQPYSAIASNYYPTPQRRTSLSPRLDYQLNANNTLSLRYTYSENNRLLTGVSGFNTPGFTVGNLSLPGTGYSSSDKEQTAQVVETAVLNPRTIMESRFQFDHEVESYGSQSAAPTLSVGQAFVAGGSGYTAPGFGNAHTKEDGYELQNYTSRTWGTHTTKFGVRVRTSVLSDFSPKSYNGTYQFLGGPGTSSIQQFLQTEQLLQSGASPSAIASAGFGPSKYQVNAGNPYISFYQMDFGPFVQDDWKARPNLTLSYGLRWETQTNIPNISSWAPRFALAWSPDGGNSNKRPKTVIRAGWGIFYDRFQITNVETAYRYSSSSQQTYQLNNPFSVLTQFDPTFSTPLPLSLLSATSSSNQRFQIDSALQAPRLMQTAVTLERQLFNRTNLTVNFSNTRGTHQLRTVDINSPVAIPGQLPPGAAVSIPGQTQETNNNIGIRPYGASAGDIYDYQSTGTLKQTQVTVGLNSQLGKWLMLFTRYSYLNSHSDTDGLSSVPNNPYDLRAEWGQSNLNINHTVFVGGSVSARWGIRLSPFLVAHSGQPFNITTGTDLYQQGSITPTARPALLQGATDIANPGSYNSVPLVGAPVLPRNYGVGAGYIGLNLRVSKTWGFGETKFSGPSGGARSRDGGFGGRGGFGGPGGFGGESSVHRYNLTLSLNARNVLNHENLNTFNGSLTSPYFFQATNITGGFGAEATASNQRRMDIQLRFAF